MAKEKDKKLDGVVHGKIKGLGLDALFHQVDINQKDTPLRNEKAAPPPSTPGAIQQSPSEKKSNLRLKTINLFVSQISELFSQQPTTHIAIAVGSHSLKTITVKETKSIPQLENASYTPIPHIIARSEEKRAEFIKKHLQDIPHSQNARISLLVPRNRVIIRFISIPTQNKEEIDKMLEFEIEHHIPFAISEIEYDYHVLGVRDNKTDIILAAVKKDELASHLNLVTSIGMQPATLSVSSLSVYNALISSTHPEGISLQVYIGSESTDLAITKDGELRFCRAWEWGSRNLTKHLMDSLNLDFENAESLKIQTGIILKNSERSSKEPTGQKIICHWADELIDEINRTLEHFKLYSGEAKLDRLILSGGGSTLLNLNEYIREKMQIKSILHRSPKALQIACDPVLFNKHFQKLSILLGMIKPLANSSSIDINLIPRNMRLAQLKKQNTIALTLKAGALILVIAALFLVPAGVLGARNFEIALLNNRLQKESEKSAHVSQLQDKVKTIQDYIATDQSSMEVMREIALTVSGDIIVERFSYERDTDVIISGTAASHDSAFALSESLSESHMFTSANVRYTTKLDRLRENVSFEIICKLKDN